MKVGRIRDIFLIWRSAWHYKQGTICQIKINDKEFITSHKLIFAECVTFLQET